MAWNIVRHAFVIVFGNFGNALRASAVPSILLICVFGLVATVSGLPLTGADVPVENLEQPMLSALLIIAGFAFAMFAFSWVAVTWHRFILLEEYPAIVPATSGRPIWPYARRTLMIVLQMTAVMVPLFLVFGGLLLMSPTMAMVVTIGLSILMTFLWLRVSVSLPSVAVGTHMGSVHAWGETNGIWQTILGVCVIMTVLNFVATLIPSVLFSNLPFVAGAMNIAIQWLSMMIGVSVLTTIYGHVIEGRPLSGA